MLRKRNKQPSFVKEGEIRRLIRSACRWDKAVLKEALVHLCAHGDPFYAGTETVHEQHNGLCSLPQPQEPWIHLPNYLDERLVTEGMERYGDCAPDCLSDILTLAEYSCSATGKHYEETWYDSEDLSGCRHIRWVDGERVRIPFYTQTKAQRKALARRIQTM